MVVGVRSVLTNPPCGSPVSYGCVRSIDVSSGSRWVHFRAPLRVIVIVRLRSVHSRPPWWLSGSFRCARAIHVRAAVVIPGVP